MMIKLPVVKRNTTEDVIKNTGLCPNRNLVIMCIIAK